MNRIDWSDHAQRDLKSIRAYIAKGSLRNAQRFTSRIKKVASSLQRFPESGGWMPEVGLEDVRQIFVGDYRIIYHFDGDQVVTILRAMHGAQLVPDSLNQL